MSTQTRDSIIQRGLNMSGNNVKSVRDEAVVALADFIDELERNHRWAHLQETATGSLAKSASSVALPGDFEDIWNEHGLKLKDSNGKFQQLTIRDEDFLDLLADPATEGSPTEAIFDLNEKIWIPYPRPDVGTFTWELRYKEKPARMGTGTIDVTPEFPFDQILVQFVYWFGLRYDDDDRAGPELGLLNAMIRKAHGRGNRSKLRTETVQFNPKFFQRPVAFR